MINKEKLFYDGWFNKYTFYGCSDDSHLVLPDVSTGTTKKKKTSGNA